MKIRSASAAVVMLSLLTLAVCAAFAQSAAKAPAVATVAGRRIERAEYEARLATLRAQVAQRGGERPAEFQELLRRQVLETMVRLELLKLEAKRQGLTPTTAEAESSLQRDPFFSPQGRFDADRWRLTRLSQPEKFAAAVAASGEQLAARRLDERMQARFQPDPGEVSSKALRQLRRAITDDLSLRTSDFKGTYPEPRESEIGEYYRTHLEDFRQPARATLSIAFVNDPPMTEVERQNASLTAAWKQRMKQAADSVLALIRAGKSLEAATVGYGGPRPDVTVIPDNFPGYWLGDAAQSAQVFRSEPDRVLEAPVPGTEGYLIVRVDRVTPSSVSTLAAVAREIRGRLREESRLHHTEREARALYLQTRESLAQPAWSVRWAAVDTAAVRVPEPGEADLERWYRGHLADFSSFDAASGTIVAKPLREVRGEVVARWRRDTRVALARAQADELYRAWATGRRAPALETAWRARESAPTPKGAPFDTGFAAAAFRDTLWSRGEPKGTGLATFGRGFLVWQVTGKLASQVPTFEQVQPRLVTTLMERERTEAIAGARALYDADPMRFGGGKVLHFSRLTVPWPTLLSVRLTRTQVEQFYRRNLDKYSAQELVRARHILISPIAATQAADRAARSRADSMLARIRAGESFARLAERYSEDPATKDKGGDLGVFARGAMLQAFEDAAFAMRVGDLTGPIKTEVGYHIIECTEHVDAYLQPLTQIYAIVASDLAKQQADTLARQRADSLIRSIGSAAEARAIAASTGFEMQQYLHPVDARMPNEQLRDYFDELAAMRPGQVMRRTRQFKGGGYWITWLDSVSTAGKPPWEEARDKALAAYREGDLSLARETGEEAVALFRRLGDALSVARVRNSLGLVYKQFCEWEPAITHLEAALHHYRETGRGPETAPPLMNLGIVHQKTGAWDRAAHCYREAEQAWIAVGDDFHLAMVNIGLGNVARLQRRFPEAESHLLAALERARRHGGQREEVLALEFLGELDFDRGRPEAAVARYHEALALAARTAPEGDLVVELERRRAEALLAIGRLDEADRALDRAMRLARFTDDRLEHAVTHRVAGELALARGQRFDAREHWEQALQLLTACRDRFECARVHLRLARLADEPRAARTHALKACAGFAEVGATHLLETAEAELARLMGVPGAATPRLEAAAGKRHRAPGLVACSSRMATVERLARRAAATELSVLVTGETGTGKELVARTIHAGSPRAHKTFLAVNCGALRADLALSQLFGHRKGAFTGAHAEGVGLVEAANGGTLFLDEAGELPLDVQVTLLRFLETGEYLRLGETQVRRADVRIIAATHRALRGEVAEDRFRQDLLYRLNEIEIRLPALRERVEDIVPLARHFLAFYGGLEGPRLSAEAEDVLVACAWPGNVRELENLMKRLAALHEGEGAIGAAAILPLLAEPPATRAPLADRRTSERDAILSAWRQAHGNKSRLADLLGVSRKTLYARLKRLDLKL